MMAELTKEEIKRLETIYPELKWDELTETGKTMWAIIYKNVWSPEAIAQMIIGPPVDYLDIIKKKE